MNKQIFSLIFSTTFFLLFLYSEKSLADNFYLSAGIGLHMENKDCPEVCFGENLLTRIRFGYETKNFNFELNHTSAPQIKENGYGMNGVFVDYIIRF